MTAGFEKSCRKASVTETAQLSRLIPSAPCFRPGRSSRNSARRSSTSAARGQRAGTWFNQLFARFDTRLAFQKARNPVEVVEPTEKRNAAQLTLRAFEKLENEKPSFARQEAHEIRLCNLFQRTLRRLESCQDRKIRNETNSALNSLQRAA